VNTIIELHDSQLVGIASQGGTVTVHFQPAGLHKSEGRPGFDPGTYWLQEARLIFADASVSGDFPDLPYNVMDGTLVTGSEHYWDTIPVPFEVTHRVELRLKLDNIHRVTVVGRGARLEFVGEPRYLQDFPWGTSGHGDRAP
jgi:hypothetical protein